MATREIITYVCDLCGTDQLVSKHRMLVDDHAVELDACDGCWAGILAHFAGVAKAGRAPTPKKVTKRTEVVGFPGESWKFSFHSLRRMGERKISPERVIAAIENPEWTRPGYGSPDAEVRYRGNVKAVVDPTKRVVVTTANRDDDEEAVI